MISALQELELEDIKKRLEEIRRWRMRRLAAIRHTKARVRGRKHNPGKLEQEKISSTSQSTVLHVSFLAAESRLLNVPFFHPTQQKDIKALPSSRCHLLQLDAIIVYDCCVRLVSELSFAHYKYKHWQRAHQRFCFSCDVSPTRSTMMNRTAAARSLVRGLMSNSSCNRSHTWCYCSSLARPLAIELRRHCGGSGFGVVHWTRMMSGVTAQKENEVRKVERALEDADEKVKKSGHEVAVSSYWGVARSEITREDGTKWPWNCFMPWETYRADLSIDLKKHHVPKTIVDKVAYRTVKLLRIPTDIFFQRRYGCRAMMLETVAAVPGMVGGMLLHLRSLRKFEHSGGWIKALLEEAENERMHLMTMVELVKPKWYERLLVLAVQGVFFNAYFVMYILSPKLAHRVVGYLEEEAIHSYTEYLKDINSGAIENVTAPAIAIDYWRLSKDATLKDVITVIRADEAHHRDVNHFASDIHFQGRELKESPAPLGYH
ncbi:hypothetical protein SAY87_007990 [Trapa incisa]|uniref:Ubiquinol oxidase n=1 Tax=Trapa incisa TaxID=236973 RepID=A0AAN7KCH6_9MYRT|nr:hypothetical protein SAY87_007990 [Trapa incisa]